MKVLFITVGGSDKPIVFAIDQVKPRYTVFICSEDSVKHVNGEGNVCGDYEREDGKSIFKPTRPSIINQAGLKEDDYTIITVNPDDPLDVYDVMLESSKKYVDDEVLLDYTGGTKSMSAGVLLASLEIENCSVRYVGGLRTDTDRVHGGMLSENLGKRVRMHFQVNMARKQVERQDYHSAESLMSYADLGETKLSRQALQYFRMFTHAIALWDRFEYGDAHETLEAYIRYAKPDPKSTLLDCKIRLSKLMKAQQLLKDKELSRLDRKRIEECNMLVYDIIRNAERKARHGYYDDAVARCYRALELYAQLALLEYGIPVGEIPASALQQCQPERLNYYLSKQHEENKLFLGLQDRYDLLADLGTEIGGVWSAYRNRLMDVLKIRNYSFLAHGLKPVSKDDYERMYAAVQSFIKECDDRHWGDFKVSLASYEDLPNHF